MSKILSRRKLITTGLATAAGASGLAVAARLADRYGLIPPDHGGIYGVGETLTYATPAAPDVAPFARARIQPQRNLQSRSRQWRSSRETKPISACLAGGFADWRLTVDGLVARPLVFLARGTEALSFPHPDHPSGLRRRLVLHRRMDRRASFLCFESGRRPPAGQVRRLLSLRRIVGQPGHARRVASANVACLRHERPGRFPRHTALRFVCASPASSATRA